MRDDYFTIDQMPLAVDADGVPAAQVCLSGEFDLDTRDDLRAVLLGLVGDGSAGRIVVDLGNVTFIDSEAVGALIDAYAAAERAGVGFRAVHSRGIVRRVLGVIGMLERFEANDADRTGPEARRRLAP